jgi:hypothetical protein
MTRAFIVFTITSLLLACGCVTADKMVLDSTPRPRTTAVDIYKDGKLPERNFKEIAELSFLGPREEELRAQKRFVRQAQELGGNGILFSIASGGYKGGGTVFQTATWVFRAKVIVYE